MVAPETAAVSAITGVITDPRDFAKEHGIEPYYFQVPDKFLQDESAFIMPENNPDQVIRKGPNIKPIPEFGAMGDSVEGEVLLKLEDDISTDFICPAGALYLPIRSNIPEISKHSFQIVDSTFYDRAMARKAEGKSSILVAGYNYGQGSSREQAAIIPRYLAVNAIVSKGFARLHLANMVNWGILPLLFVNHGDYEKISQGDILMLDTGKLIEGKIYTLKNKTKNIDILVKSPVFQSDLDCIKKGGMINIVKEKNSDTKN